jgi:integrase
MGSLYKRGSVWWIKYYYRGKMIRESSKSTKKTVAQRFLDLREGEVAQSKVPGYYFDKVTFDDLYTDLKNDWELRGLKNRKKNEARVDKHLVPFFGGLRAIDVTSDKVAEYKTMRQVQKAANGTINRELAILGAMLRLGARQTPPKVDRVLHIDKLPESNPREVYFEPRDFETLLKHLKDYMKGPTTFAYRTGWRLQEVLGLTWDRVDHKQGIVRLEGRETKNKEARNLYLDPELHKLIREEFKRRYKGCPYVFHREGSRIKNYYPAWRTACKRANLDGRTFHDFRRTASRNMVRAGVPEKVVMGVTGHKTRSVFERYNIVSGDDLKQAAEKQAAYLAEKHDRHNSRHKTENRDQQEVVPIPRTSRND